MNNEEYSIEYQKKKLSPAVYKLGILLLAVGLIHAKAS